MTTYYVDPGASGANNGSSWTDAWTSIQSAIDNGSLAGGDTVFCRGTQNTSAAIDFDGNSGTYSNQIRFVGCNASTGSVDGSRFTINGGSSGTFHGLNINAQNFITLENIAIVSTASTGAYHGVYTAATTYNWTFSNCLVDGWPTNGFVTTNLYYTCYLRTISSNNGGVGFYRPRNLSVLVACVAHSNGVSGFASTANVQFYGCLSYDNTSEGFDLNGINSLYNCVAHGNGAPGFYDDGTPCCMTGCRSTNNTIGFHGDLTNYPTAMMYCYAQGNSTSATSGSVQQIRSNGADTNDMSGSDTDYGYTNSSANDFNLTSSATLRSVEIQL